MCSKSPSSCTTLGRAPRFSSRSRSSTLHRSSVNLRPFCPRRRRDPHKDSRLFSSEGIFPLPINDLYKLIHGRPLPPSLPTRLRHNHRSHPEPLPPVSFPAASTSQPPPQTQQLQCPGQPSCPHPMLRYSAGRPYRTGHPLHRDGLSVRTVCHCIKEPENDSFALRLGAIEVSPHARQHRLP